MNKIFSAFCLLIIFMAAEFSFAQKLYNSNKAGINIRSMEKLLSLDNEEIDIASGVLHFSKYWQKMSNVIRYRYMIDDMSSEILKRLNRRNIPRDYRALAVINEYLFDELGFKAVDNADNPQDLFLHTVLNKKRGYCLSLSILYLSIGERIGIPLCGVAVPGHFFVRYDDGNRMINIETTNAGAFVKNKYYLEKFAPPKNTLYMKNLSPRETLGCFFNNLGNCYMQITEIENAKHILTLATELTPTLAEAKMNLGNAFLITQEFAQAIEQYQGVLEINPNDTNVLNSCASAYSKLGEYENAKELFLRVIELMPNSVTAHLGLAFCDSNLGRNNAAISRFVRVISLSPQNIDAHLGLAYAYYNLDEKFSEIETYEKLLQFAPNNFAALYNIGLSCNAIEEYENAKDYFLHAVEIKPADGKARNALAMNYYAMKNYKQALKHLKLAQSYGFDVSINLLNRLERIVSN